MQCSICGAPAKNLTPGSFEGLVVSCPHCGTYEIADSALNGFLRLDFDRRAEALQKAKRFAAPGARPTIKITWL
jgi:transposase